MNQLARPQATPRFYLAAVEKNLESPWLRDKIWERPGDEAMNQLQDLSATNLSDPLMEVNEMLTVYSFSVQRQLKSTVIHIMKSPTCTIYVGLAQACHNYSQAHELACAVYHIPSVFQLSETKYSNGTKFNFCTFAAQSTTLLKLGKVTQKFSVPMGLTDH